MKVQSKIEVDISAAELQRIVSDYLWDELGLESGDELFVSFNQDSEDQKLVTASAVALKGQ